MLVPSIFGKDLWSDFNFPFSENRRNDLMKTDVKDLDTVYEMTIDLPGVKKEDVKAELKEGYLTISATSGYSTDDKDDNGRYIRRERHYGSCSRTFYVGEGIKKEEIKASFENGTLKLTVPKEAQKALPEDNFISIE